MCQLLSLIHIYAPLGLVLSGLALDSREVKPGTLFFALPGEKEDGGDLIAEAMTRGAVCVVCERPPEGDLSLIHI